ncbi:hypothetical protein FGIG_09431 [Fasciola gigantica]|uniref:FYVE-type domain-containing protein n=1 Tax=Fasciola gigantica TaxID=46835 RepID=A0A504Y6X2_FASGI|nr:hypothetical protein FGIG_09431 [Fasciola gigantica]
MSSQEGRQFSCLGEPCVTSSNEPEPPKPGIPVKNEEIVNRNKLTPVSQIDPSIKNSLPIESDDPTGNNETLEHSMEQEFLSKPPVNLSFVCDATRKRLLEADEEEKTTENQSTSNSLRNLSEHQNDVLRRPPERPTSLSLPRATAVRPVKRPSFLPIPLQFSSQSNNCSHTVENDDAATSSPSESKAAYTRTIVSGRRVLQSSQTLLGSSLRIPFESQCKADSRQELGTVWEPLSPKDVGTCAPPWAPDHLASSSCMLCSARFSLIRAKQHCRACGRIVCAMCCTRWVLLPYLAYPLPGLEQSANDVSMVGEDTVNTASENSSTPSSATTSPSLFQRSYSSPERYSRVCELCYGILAKYPTPVAATKPQTSSLIQPPSPKRQRSIPPSSSSSIRPSMTSSKHCDLLIDVSKVDLKQSTQCRSEDLLHPLHPVYGNAEEKPNGTEEEQWPPLVISLHTKLSLHKNPPKDVLLARLSSNESLSRDCHHRNAQNSFSDVSTEGWPRFPVAVQDANHVAPVFPSVATCQSPSGITLALTRNVHLYVHATELRCCLRRPAWCFASFGLQSFGQQEVVLIVQRRPTEELPPLCVYRFYQRLYLAVSQQQQQKPTESIAPEMIALIPSHQSRRNLFRAYDTFIPQSAAGTQNGDCAQNDLTKFADNPTGLLYGCLFFHPTHQCLHGLHLPVAPFLVGHFFHQTEAYWAKYLPLRLLLRLGKSMRHYPTPLLCDLDRDPVFHFNNGTGVLPWLSTLTDPIPVVLENTNHLETIGPALLLRLTGLRIRLVSCPRSDTQVPGARLELLSDSFSFKLFAPIPPAHPRPLSPDSTHVWQSLRSHINDLRRHNHTQLAVRIQMKPPDQVGYQVASVHSELDVLIPDGPRCTTTTEDTHSPKGTFSFSPSPDPCDCSSDLECCLTPVIQSWLSRMQFDTGHLDSPSSSSISSLSPAVRTPTGPNSVGSVSEATSTPDRSPQLVIELDFYLLD